VKSQGAVDTHLCIGLGRKAPLKIFHVPFERLVCQIANDIEISRSPVIPAHMFPVS
jgi:hypothetical protein